MKIARTKNATRNMAIGMVNKIVVLVLPFFVRTAFIYSLGSEYLGLNSLFSSILTVLNITELGFSSAVVFSMYEPIAKDDDERICALLNYYRKIYRIIGSIILIGGIIIMPFLPNLINGECPDELNIYILFFIYLLNTALSYMLFAYKKSILEAFQRNDYISLNDTITTGLTNVVQLIILLLWKSIYAYYAYIFSMLLFTIINNFLNSNIVNKKFPQYKCSGQINSADKAKIKRQVSGLMVSRICQMTRNSFDSIFVSAFISLTMTTIYNNYYYVVNAVVGLMNVITAAMLAGIGNSLTTESQHKNYHDFTLFNFIYVWISGWAAVTMLCLYQDFMIMWVGEELTLPFLMAVIFTIYFYALKICDIRITYVSAAGLWWENRFRSLLETIANIVLNYFFVRVWGVYGIVIATVIPLVIINFYFGGRILFKHYFTEYKITEYLLDNIGYAVVTLVAAVLTLSITNLIKAEGFLNLIIKGMICCVVPNIIFILFYFKTEKFILARKWVLSKMNHK